MFILRVKKGTPLRIEHKPSGDILEIHCPTDHKNTGIKVAFNLTDNYKVIHTKQIVGEQDDDESDDNFNK